MFDCSYDAEYWIRHALECLPDNVLDAFSDKLAFVCMDTSDARRLTRSFCEGREIICLSERIVPRGSLSEDNSQVRYFWFVVLHEVAHAVCQHRPPNEITEAENEAQENEANNLAFKWFNDYLTQKNLQEFSEKELMQAQAASRDAAVKAFSSN